MKNSNKLGILFSILCVVSVFLPWAESTASVGSSFGSSSASSGNLSGITLGVGIAGLLLGLGSLYSSFKRLKYTWILGLVMLVDGVYYLLTMNASGVSSSSSYGGASVSVSSSVDPQFGLFIFTISALLLSIFTLKDRKS
tara:strand:+ start:5727 stop:6146 length:420 start_codon:yes stop_codon:yes gene_type:complete